MCGLPTRQLPYTLDGTEIRALGRKKLQGKARLGLAAPVLMHSGMVVGSIIEDNNDTAASVATDLAQVLKESEKGIPIELALLALEHELAVP
ncbi:MAG: hypothetical protein J4G05_09835 [Chlorobi bacterium]|nr:hypothetical protein [Chlorobiota bacterium]